MPAIPAFYHQPKTIDDLVTQYVCRVLAQIGLPQEKMYRWQRNRTASREKGRGLNGDRTQRRMQLRT